MVGRQHPAGIDVSNRSRAGISYGEEEAGGIAGGDDLSGLVEHHEATNHVL